MRHCHCIICYTYRLTDFVDRRAQYLVAGSTIVSASEAEVFEDEEEDEEAHLGYFDEHDEDNYYDSDDDDDSADTTPRDDFVSQLQWDEDIPSSDSDALPAGQPQVSASLPASRRMFNPRSKKENTLKPMPLSWGANRDTKPQETTPLLSKKISFGVPSQAPRRLSTTTKYGGQERGLDFNAPCHATQRRLSNVSVARSTRSVTRSIKHTHVGRSTFGQTVCCPSSNSLKV